MSPYIAVALSLAVAGSIGGAYFVGRSAGVDSCEAAKAREERLVAKAAEATASAAAGAIRQIKVTNVHNREVVERETREVPVYRDCRHSPDGLRGINAALAGTPASVPAGGGELPRADATQ